MSLRGYVGTVGLLGSAGRLRVVAGGCEEVHVGGGRPTGGLHLLLELGNSALQLLPRIALPPQLLLKLLTILLGTVQPPA